MSQRQLDPVQIYTHAVEQARQTLVGIKPAQRHLPTPCTEWDVATVAEHMLTAHTGWATRIAGEPPPVVNRRRLGTTS